LLLRDQIRKKPVRPRHARRQLPEKADASVDEPAFAVVAGDQRAVQRIFAGIVPGDRRGVAGIAFAREVEAAFLHPALEVGGGDLLRRVQRRGLGPEEGGLGSLHWHACACELDRVWAEGLRVEWVVGGAAEEARRGIVLLLQGGARF